MSRFLLVLAMAATTILGACQSDTNARGESTSTKSLVSYNYAAVDALMTRAGKNITKTTPMLVGTIGNVDNVETSSTLGRTVTEQLSARLAQKGYKVAELKLRQGISVQRGGLNSTSSGEYLLSRDVNEISGEHKAAAALTGTYSVGARNILVNLRLLDIRSGNVITAYDYVLPKTADITSLVANGTGGSGNTAGSFFKGLGDY